MRGLEDSHKSGYISLVRRFITQSGRHRRYRKYALTALLFVAGAATAPRHLSGQLIQNHPHLKPEVRDSSSKTGLLNMWISGLTVNHATGEGRGSSSGLRGEAGISSVRKNRAYLQVGVWGGKAAPVRGFGISIPADSLGTATSLTESAAYATIIKEFGRSVEISSSLLFSSSSYGHSYALYGQAKVKMHRNFDIHVGMRPSFDRFNSSWNNGVNVGLTLMPYTSNFLTVSLAQTSRRDYEPSVRYTAEYELYPTSNSWVKAVVETGGGDRHRFSEAGISGGVYANKRLGFSISMSERKKSAANRQLGAGILWRQ